MCNSNIISVNVFGFESRFYDILFCSYLGDMHVIIGIPYYLINLTIRILKTRDNLEKAKIMLVRPTFN